MFSSGTVSVRHKWQAEELPVPGFCSSSWSQYLKWWFSLSAALLNSECYLDLCCCTALRAYFYVDITSSLFLFSAFSSLHSRSICKMCCYCLQHTDKLINTASNALQFSPRCPRVRVNWLKLISLLNRCYYCLCVKTIFLILRRFLGSKYFLGWVIFNPCWGKKKSKYNFCF